MRKCLLLAVGLSLVIAQGRMARAQTQAVADLYPPVTSSYPNIAAFLDVFDTNGIFASGLQPEVVTIIEDGQNLPAQTLGETAVPLQIVVGVNQSEGLDIRDPGGLSRYDRIVQVLSGWVQTRPTDLPDDLSLVSQTGPVINHAGPVDFLTGFGSFKPDFRAATPNLQSLSIAIDTAAGQTPRVGMKRAVLFITSHMDDPNIVSEIQQYIQHARDNKVRVFVWFVDGDLYGTTTSAAAFNSLALETGGSLFLFSGLESFPDPETYFSPLRRVYSLSYASAIKSAGEHSLRVQVELSSGVIQSQEHSFDLDVQPPNPILVSAPLQITRQASAEDPFNTKVLLPEQQELDIIVEFPDQHPRPLVRTTLYIDGQVVDENASDPFDHFIWDLSGYATSGEHSVYVEVVDSLGMSKSSTSIPVTVTVIQPPRGPAVLLARYRQPITIGAIAIAAFALLAILLTGRLRFPSLRKARAARLADRDPLTQPVAADTTLPVPTTKDKLKRKQAAGKDKTESKPHLDTAPATLMRLAPDGSPATDKPLALFEREINFGTDPVQCNQVLDDPSLSPLHARLKRLEDGSFLLLDNNSIAGTWVNYEPVPLEGYRLVHGDMVHFGRLFYRFILRNSPPVSEPVIEFQKPEA